MLNELPTMITFQMLDKVLDEESNKDFFVYSFPVTFFANAMTLLIIAIAH